MMLSGSELELEFGRYQGNGIGPLEVTDWDFGESLCVKYMFDKLLKIYEDAGVQYLNILN